MGKRVNQAVRSFCRELGNRGILLGHKLAVDRSVSSSKRCRICGNAKKNEELQVAEMFLGSRHMFSYCLCSCCSSLSICKIPKVLGEFYRNYYTVGAPPLLQSKFRNFLEKATLNFNADWGSKLASFFLGNQDDFALKAIRRCRVRKNSRILDVGCGSGNLVAKLRSFGYVNTIGIDPFVDINRNLLGSVVHKKSMREVDEKYDLIMFHHSFEHVADPNEILSCIKKALNKGGKCLIRLPNIDSFGFKLFKNNWFGIHPPYHLNLPSLKGFKIMCSKYGLEIIDFWEEQMPEFLMYSRNYSRGVGDFDIGGLRAFLGYSSLGFQMPPGFSRKECRYWKKKAKLAAKRRQADWRCYCIGIKSDSI